MKLFAGACASCHQWNGLGRQTPRASLLRLRSVNDTYGMNLTRMILDGVDVRVRGQDVHMPAFGHAYSDAEVAALANYVIAQFGNKQGRVTPALVAERRKQ